MVTPLPPTEKASQLADLSPLIWAGGPGTFSERCLLTTLHSDLGGAEDCGRWRRAIWAPQEGPSTHRLLGAPAEVFAPQKMGPTSLLEGLEGLQKGGAASLN